jgi:hypothetical protein
VGTDLRKKYHAEGSIMIPVQLDRIMVEDNLRRLRLLLTNSTACLGDFFNPTWKIPEY